MIKKFIAFTLAETLIVIAIIGVVAALTLPNLNSSTADKEKVTKVKKLYAELTEALDRAVVVYGPIPAWFENKTIIDYDYSEQTKIVKDRIKKFMKVSKDCEKAEGCLSTNPLVDYNDDILAGIDNFYAYSYSHNSFSMILSDGTSCEISANYMGGSQLDSLLGFNIFCDIDGPNKGKTQLGNDVFAFLLYRPEWKIIPYDTGSGNFKKIHYPTGWVINNDNLDYLKADCSSGTCICPDGEPLNWETKTSCN